MAMEETKSVVSWPKIYQPYVLSEIDCKGVLQQTQKERQGSSGRIFWECKLSIIQADRKIIDSKMDSGSTGTVCFITLEEAKRLLYVAHVGDSSAYLYNDNQSEKLTADHRGNNQK